MAVLTAAAALGSIFFSPVAKAGHVASMRIIVSLPTEPKNPNFFQYDKYYSWVSSEYLADDFAQVIKSQAFLQDVKTAMGNPQANPVVQESFRVQRTHRILSIEIRADGPEEARRTAAAMVQAIETQAPKYFAQLQSGDAKVQVIDPPVITSEGGSPRNLLNIALRSALGFLVGIGLTFLLHYLDTTIYESSEVEELLHLSVLGEIPQEPQHGVLPWPAFFQKGRGSP